MNNLALNGKYIEIENQDIIIFDDTCHIGIINIPFKELLDNDFDNHFLYYGNSKITDKVNIISPYVYNNDMFHNTGIHKLICIGTIKEGDLIGTSHFYGICRMVGMDELAFARSLSTKSLEGCDLIDAIFI